MATRDTSCGSRPRATSKGLAAELERGLPHPVWAIFEDRRDAFAMALSAEISRAAGFLADLLVDPYALIGQSRGPGRAGLGPPRGPVPGPPDYVFTLISYGRYEDALKVVASVGLKDDGRPFSPGWFGQFIERWKRDGERRTPGKWSAGYRTPPMAALTRT